MAVEYPVFPSLSSRFYWEGALEYIDPQRDNYQRAFLLFVACIFSLGHEFEKSCSYDYSSYVRLNTVSKVLISASNYWRVYDLTNGIKSAVEKLDTDLQESVFKVVGAFTSAAFLLIHLCNRGVISGIPVQSCKLYVDIIGTVVYFRKTLLKWNQMRDVSKIESKVRVQAYNHLKTVAYIRNAADTITCLVIFITKVVGLTVLKANTSQYQVVRLIIDYQSKLFTGCFTMATAALLISHYFDRYIKLYIDLNKKGL